MQESSSHDFLTRAVGYAVGFVGVGGLLGYLQYRLAANRAPVDMRLSDAQADVQVATAEGIRHATVREDESSAVANLNVAIQALKDSVGGLKTDRDEWRARALAAEGQIELIKARRKIEESER